MPEPTFPDLPVLGELALALDAAMARETTAADAAATTLLAAPATPSRAAAVPNSLAAEDPATPGDAPRRARWWRAHGPIPAVVFALLLGGLGTSTAAATLTVLRGSPIPSPRRADVQPLMRPAVGTATVLPLRARHLGAGAPFALRTSRSETGLTCVAVGQSSRGRFGITGTDGHFRDLPAAIVNGCGQAGPNRPAVLGARIFDDHRYAAVRTVAYGVAGSDLRRAEVQSRGSWTAVPTSGGAFVAAVRGYTEDVALRVRLTFASGKRIEYPLGVSPYAIPDPIGPAWRADAGTTSGSGTLCAGLGALRASSDTPRPPEVCGRLKTPRSAYLLKPYVLSIRTFRPGDRGGPPRDIVPGAQWNWHRAAPRTIAYGLVDHRRIASIRVTANGKPVDANLKPGSAFAAIMLGNVPASAVRVTFVPKHGAPQTLDHGVNEVGSRTGDHR